jgi:uncharacterized membrane protein
MEVTQKMVTDIQVVLLIVAGLVGTVISLGLGWSESADPFDVKKAVSTIIRGAMGAAIFVVATYATAVDVAIWDYIAVAIFAAGFDVLLKRGQGAYDTQKTLEAKK